MVARSIIITWLAAPLLNVLLVIASMSAAASSREDGPSSATPRQFLPEIQDTFPGDNRFGAVVTGMAASQALSQLSINWWYSYGSDSPSPIGSGVAQISMRPDGVNVTQVPAATLQANARANPGGYWIIGNEPNVPGQDNVTVDVYATQLQYYVSTIKGTDPTARIVGPSVLNWDATCTGCGGFQSGHSWVDSFRSYWAGQFGGEPPFDAWAIHAYQISWDQLPMTNAVLVEQQISAFSTYLAAIPADASTPLWLSEFGVIWGFDGWTTATSGCVAAPNCIAPTGSLDDTAVSSYLTTLISWLSANSTNIRLDRWFLYTTVGLPEPYATTFGGISLFENGALTSFGQSYRQAALMQPGAQSFRTGSSAFPVRVNRHGTTPQTK